MKVSCSIGNFQLMKTYCASEPIVRACKYQKQTTPPEPMGTFDVKKMTLQLPITIYIHIITTQLGSLFKHVFSKLSGFTNCIFNPKKYQLETVLNPYKYSEQ